VRTPSRSVGAVVVVVVVVVRVSGLGPTVAALGQTRFMFGG
jgi:hypothetical protein